MGVSRLPQCSSELRDGLRGYLLRPCMLWPGGGAAVARLRSPQGGGAEWLDLLALPTPSAEEQNSRCGDGCFGDDDGNVHAICA